MKNEAFAMISYSNCGNIFYIGFEGTVISNLFKIRKHIWYGGDGHSHYHYFNDWQQFNFFINSRPLISGAFIGIYVAKKVEMTKMPELVALMHSFVGLAAVLIATAAVLNVSEVHSVVQRFELFIGAFIGAITFSASVIAFGKLSGKFGANPSIFKGQHLLNLVLAIIMIGAG